MSPCSMLESDYAKDEQYYGMKLRKSVKVSTGLSARLTVANTIQKSSQPSARTTNLRTYRRIPTSMSAIARNGACAATTVPPRLSSGGRGFPVKTSMMAV
jgi:hypothetical protein